METSEVRKRLLATVDRARRAAAERRTRVDEASREYSVLLDQVAVPLFRQLANVLKAHGYPFNLFTPGGSVRLMSERSSEDYIEMALDTTEDTPHVIGRSSRGRGHRVVESEQLIGEGPVRDLTEEDILRFVLKELEPFLEK
jgi:hypothetical protein